MKIMKKQPESGVVTKAEIQTTILDQTDPHFLEANNPVSYPGHLGVAGAVLTKTASGSVLLRCHSTRNKRSDTQQS